MVSQSTQKWILTFFMFLNGFITPGGIIYGWPGLAQLLKDEGEYSSDCPDYDPKKTCSSQDNKLNNIFAVGANVATASTIVYGFTLDRYGVRANAVSGALLMCAGFLLMAFSTTVGEHPFDAFLPGFALIAFGGLGTYLPAFQFSALFSRPTRILSIQSALFGAAGLTFTFFKFLAENEGIHRKTSFVGYAILCAFCALNMVLLYPKSSYKGGDPIHLPVLGWLGIQKPPLTPRDGMLNAGNAGTDYSPLQEAEEEHSSERSSSKLDSLAQDALAPSSTVLSPESDTDGLVMLPPPVGSTPAPAPLTPEEVNFLRHERRLRDLTPDEKAKLLDSRSLREEFLDAGTILVAMHFSIGLLCCNMYNANISTLLKNMGDTDGKFADAFVFITSLYPMLFSLSIDELQQRFRYAGTSFIATTGIIVGLAFLYIPNLYAQIPAFFILGTGRSLLITVMFSFVSVEYRSDHYGRVVAFVTAICACIGCLQIALQKILNGPANDEFDYFTTGMIVAMTPLYYFSYWCHKQRV